MNERKPSVAPAIVFGCQKPGWGIIRALGKAKIPVIGVYYDPSDPASASRYVSESFACPHPEYAEAAFHDFVAKLAARWPEAVMLPSNDYTLVALSRVPDALAEQMRIAAPARHIVEQCISKDRTYRLAESLGVRAPRTATATNLKEALEHAKAIGFPCLLKPAVGHRFFAVMRVKMFEIASAEMLRAIWQRIADHTGDILIQELIPGGDDHGANYNALWEQGEPAVEVTAAKLRLSPRGIGFPTVVTNNYIPEIIEPARKLLTTLRFDGFANVEFKRDSRNGEYVLMEINPRLNQSLLLSVETGVNFAEMVYRRALHGAVDSDLSIDPYGVRRFYIDTDRDIREALSGFRSGQLTFRSFIAPYFARQVSATFAWSDPLPFLKRLVRAVLPR